MYCRNCGNEVNDKAVACPKCGVNPHSEKKFCPSCSTATNPNQAVCTKCGVSLESKSFSLDTSGLQNIDFGSLIKNPAFVSPTVGLLACFFPWVKMNAWLVKTSYSLFSLGAPLMMADTIISPLLLYFLPLSLLLLVVSQFSPKVAQYKKVFAIVAVALVVYAGIGLYQLITPDAPTPTRSNNGLVNGIMDMAQDMSRSATKDIFSIGFGFYIAAAATLASGFFSGLISKKQ